MSDLFKAQKAVEARFKEETSKGYACKFYYYNDGQIVESENRPNHNTPGFKFECQRNGDKINCISID